MPKFLISQSDAATIKALGEALDLLELGVVVLDSALRPLIVSRRFYELVRPPRVPVTTLRDLLDGALRAPCDGDPADDVPAGLDRLEAAVQAGPFAALEIALHDDTRLLLRCAVRPDGGRLLTCSASPAKDAAQDQHAAAHDFAEQLTVELRFNNETLESQAAYLASLAEAADANAQAAVEAKRLLEHEIKERRQLEARLRHMATTDALTGVLNRAQFMTLGQREVERVRVLGVGLAVLMLDIDFFKSINDRHGHPGGDRALLHLVAVLRTGIRRIDLLGRLGGEEFAIVLPAITEDAAAEVAERLRALVAKSSFTYSTKSVSLTVSVGVAQLRDDEHTVEQVLLRADAALYAAKDSGRNRVVRAPETMLAA